MLLQLLPEQDAEEPTSIPTRLKSLKKGRRLYVVVKDLRVEKQPSILCHLYLDLPSDASEEEMKAHHIGVLNFFHAHAAGHRGKGHGKENTKVERFLSFDITAVAKKLQFKKKLKSKATLTISPAGRPASKAKPLIGEITLIEQ